MPPTCEPCNRQFRNKEAAKQHLQSSGLNHPFCDHPRCESRRFLSEQAREAHMADKHPPTFDCNNCNRSFTSAAALDDHYRGSPNHPNCAKCGLGFVDRATRDEHHQSAHIRVLCHPCGGLMMYEDALEAHYLDDAKHPTCTLCNLGFKDSAAYSEHQASAHPKPECSLCERDFPNEETLQRHYDVSPSHPDCLLCRTGFKDNDAYQEHLKAHPAQPQDETVSPGTTYGLLPPSPTPMKLITLPQSGTSYSQTVSSPVPTLQMNPLSPTTSIWTPTSPAVPLPPPGRDTKFEAAWGARANIPIQTTPPRIPCTPTNGSGAFMQAALSPTRSVQGFNNNNNLNNNTHDLLYSSPGTRSISRADNSFLDPFHSPVDGNGSTLPQELGSPQLEWRSSRTPLNAARNIQISDTQAARQGSTAIKYGLYRGDSGGSFNRWPAATTTPVPPRFLGLTSTSSGSSGGSINAGKAPLRSLATPGPSQEIVDWVELFGEKAYSVARTQSSRSEDVSSTQAVATPVSAQTASLAGYNMGPVSPSSSNFPRSPFSFSSPRDQTYLRIPLPSSPSHSKSSSYLPSIKFTPFRSVEATSQHLFSSLKSTISLSPINSQPQSPEVTSPIGLAALPAISPLASTPIDIAFPNFEARATTISSSGSAQLSAFHFAVDTHLPQSPCVASLTSASHAVSPGGTADERLTVDILSLPLPDSPSVSELASPALAAEMTPLLTSGSGMLDIERDVPDKEEHDAESATAHEEDGEEHMHDVTGTSSTVGEIKDQPSAPSLRVYCRMCQADPCVEPTATLCGHLFCYKCISEHILQDSHCPACSRAIMLNCLLTLHLSG